MQQVADDISDCIDGKLHVGCLSTFAGFVLPELRKGFEDAFQAVEIEQTHTDQARLLELLARCDIDIALTYDLGVDGGHHFEPLVSLPPHVMLPAKHPLATRSTVPLKGLSKDPMCCSTCP